MLSSESEGGAGIAAKRLCDALNEADDVESHFLDLSLLGDVPRTVVCRGSASNGVLSDTHVTGEHVGFVRQWIVDMLMEYDILNVHWASFLITTAELLALAEAGKTIVITMHDFFYSTGGCHYPASCTQQATGCTLCPQVDERTFSRSAARKAFLEKKELLGRRNVFITAPSSYLITQVLGAGLSHPGRAHAVRNVFVPPRSDQDSFTPELGNAGEVLVIADSLNERRKGTKTAIEAVALASSQLQDKLHLHVVGGAGTGLETLCRAMRVCATFHGRISSMDELATIYKRCGILLTCSGQDNWPNVLVESGTFGAIPVVGPGHGCEEFARWYEMDFVSKDYSAESFAERLVEAARARPTMGPRLSSMIYRIRTEHSASAVRTQFLSLFASAMAA
jgi:glycosyltransferase involved in cell wall biosynthesis